VTWAKTYLNLTIKTVSRPKNTPGFVVLPRRWVVDRLGVGGQQPRQELTRALGSA